MKKCVTMFFLICLISALLFGCVKAENKSKTGVLENGVTEEMTTEEAVSETDTRETATTEEAVFETPSAETTVSNKSSSVSPVSPSKTTTEQSDINYNKTGKTEAEETTVKTQIQDTPEKKPNINKSENLTGPYIKSCEASSGAVAIELSQKGTKYKLFQIDVAVDEAFSQIISSDLYDFEMTVATNLSPDTQYYLRTRGFDGSNYSAFTQTYSVKTLQVNADSVKLDAKQVDLILGEQYLLNATVYPENTTDKNIVWSSTDESVATVSQDGTVTSVGFGNAAIIVTTSNEMRAACAVHVGKNCDVGQTEALVIDKTTLNGNAVFGKYDTPDNRYGTIEENVSFDSVYNLNSYDAGNRLAGLYYYFGGLYRDVNVDGIPFSYTWTEDSDYDFEGNDCAVVSDEHVTQTLSFIGAGAYSKIHLLSLADEYLWDSVTKEWKLGTGDISASINITYKDGTTENKTVNFGNMMKKDENTPYYDAYILQKIVPKAGDYNLGSAGQTPYMYAVSVDCNPEKQISSMTFCLENEDENRRVNLAVFAVSGEICKSTPTPINKAGTVLTNVTEYGFNISWNESENADGYYVSIFRDKDCTTPCYVSIGSTKIYLTQAVLYTNESGFINEDYKPGQTYYVKIAAFNENGSSKAVVIPVKTIGTYPQEIRLTPKNATLSIGESVQLNPYFPSNSYYTYSEVVWSVSNSTVLRVTEGKVTAIGEGTATVRAALKQYPQIYAECLVTVESYGENCIGYDDGIFLDSNTDFKIAENFYSTMTYGAIKITNEQIDNAKTLDSFSYYVADNTNTVKYEIYLLEEGQTPLTAKPTASGTVPGSSVGWATVQLNETVEMTEGKEIWIAVKSNSISRADNSSENGSLAKINGHWTNLNEAGIDGTIMLRAHFTEN